MRFQKALLPILAAALAAATLPACKKDQIADPPPPSGPTLPAATDTGANVSGAYINGQLFLGSGAAGDTSGTHDFWMQQMSPTSWLLRIDLTDTSTGQTVGFGLNNFGLDTGRFKLMEVPLVGFSSDTNATGFGFYRSDTSTQPGSVRGYYTDSIYDGWAQIIKFDNRPGGIIAGRFEYTVRYKTNFYTDYAPTTDTVHISEGRFDLRLPQ